MKLGIVAAALAFVLFPTICQALTPKESCANKIYGWITQFGTRDQYMKASLLTRAGQDAAKKMAGTDIGNDLFNYAMNYVATYTQKTKAASIMMGLMNDLGGPAKANQTLYKMIPPLEARLGPLYNTLKTKITTMESNGRTLSEVMTQIFYYANNNFSWTLTQTVAKSLKAAVTVAEWSAIRNRLQGIVFFGLLGV